MLILYAILFCVETPAHRTEWESILSRLRNIERAENMLDFQILVEMKRITPRNEASSFRKYWSRRTDALRLVLERAESPKGREARVFNPRYEFSLSHKSTEEAWSLGTFYLKKTGEKSPIAIRSEVLEHWAQMFPSTGILNVRPLSLAELSKDPDFRVISIENEGQITRVSLIVPERLPGGRTPLSEVSVDFDDRLGGRIKSYSINDPRGAFVRVTNNYQISQNSAQAHPSKTIIEHFKSIKNQSLISTRTITYESVTPTKYTDRDFTLSAFGLPEPPGDETPGWGINGYLLLAASIAAVATFLFWWLARRKSA
jgi:hypothetical protein